jgi:hypothetical protein
MVPKSCNQSYKAHHIKKWSFLWGAAANQQSFIKFIMRCRVSWYPADLISQRRQVLLHGIEQILDRGIFANFQCSCFRKIALSLHICDSLLISCPVSLSNDVNSSLSLRTKHNFYLKNVLHRVFQQWINEFFVPITGKSSPVFFFIAQEFLNFNINSGEIYSHYAKWCSSNIEKEKNKPGFTLLGVYF